jgi:signal transduction histidine kinase
MNALQQETIDLDKLIFDAEYLVERRNPDAYPLAEKIVSLAIKNSDPKYFIYAKYILAFYQCLVANDYDKSIELCNEVLVRLEKQKDLTDIAYKIYMTLGNSYQLKGEIFSAQESYLKGMKLLENKKDLSQREKGYLASLYYNVSLLLGSSELNISMDVYLQKAIAIFEEIGHDFKLSKCYVAYAGIYEGKGEYEKAIEVLNKALEIDERVKDEFSIALSKANLGIQHLKINRNEESLRYLQDSLNYFAGAKMEYETAMVKVNFGETLFAIGRKEDGIKELREAEELFERQDNKRELSHVYELLSEFLAQTSEHQQAWNYQKKHTESLKYFFDVEKTKALTRAKKEFENEQKEKESALLKEKNEEIKCYVHKLEVSNNELKQFAHVASHDMREPLRMISSYMSLLGRSLKDNITEEQKTFIAFAQDGARRMEQLIIDLLRLAKVDANPRVEAVKLPAIVEEIHMNLDSLIKDKGASISSSGLPEILADKTQVLQVFQNIISNGIKYNENAMPAIDIVCVKKPDEIEISIADNGIGIPQQFREKVFEIFQRLQTRKQYSGSGIGLAICRKIVDSMNGRIWVEDNPTGGTVFRIALPNSICVS